MNEEYSITDLCTEFGLTARTIRYYEEKGLLCPRRVGNARIFDAADRVKLKLILRGKRLGFSLQESEEIISLYEPCTGNQCQLEILLEKIMEKRNVLLQQRTEINAMLKELKVTESLALEAMETIRNEN